MLNNTLIFLKDMISDVDGHVSSKRMVVFLCVIALLISWAYNLWCGVKVEQFIFDGLLYIVAVGLGVTVAEKFTRN
jgi:hypothetical protein